MPFDTIDTQEPRMVDDTSSAEELVTVPKGYLHVLLRRAECVSTRNDPAENIVVTLDDMLKAGANMSDIDPKHTELADGTTVPEIIIPQIMFSIMLGEHSEYTTLRESLAQGRLEYDDIELLIEGRSTKKITMREPLACVQNQSQEETKADPESHPPDNRPRMARTTAARLRGERQQTKADRDGP